MSNTDESKFTIVLLRAIKATTGILNIFQTMKYEIMTEIVSMRRYPIEPIVEDIQQLDSIEGEVMTPHILELNSKIVDYVKTMVENPRELGYEVGLDGDLQLMENLERKYGDDALKHLDKKYINKKIGMEVSENNVQSNLGKYAPSVSAAELELEDDLFSLASELFVVRDHLGSLQHQIAALKSGVDETPDTPLLPPSTQDNNKSIKDFIQDYDSKEGVDAKINVLRDLVIFIASNNIELKESMQTIIKGKIQEAYFDHHYDEARGWYEAVFGKDVPVRRAMAPTRRNRDIPRDRPAPKYH